MLTTISAIHKCPIQSPGELWTGGSWVSCGSWASDSAVLTWAGSSLIAEAGSFSQERVAVVETSDDERLDQDLRCFTCEEGLDPADVVESNSTRSGHGGNVGVAGQLVIQYHAKVPYSGFFFFFFFSFFFLNMSFIIRLNNIGLITLPCRVLTLWKILNPVIHPTLNPICL